MRCRSFIAGLPLLASFLVLPAEANAGDQAIAEYSGDPQAIREVVISATQRMTPIAEIPASATVFDFNRLQASNVSSLKDLTAIAPAMGVVNSIGESFGQLIRARGVTTSGADIGLEAAVGVAIDGIPLARANLAILDFQGIERVEFLRGPQGTLFGRNTTAGLLNIVTRRPGFESSFDAGASFGSREFWELRATADGAIVESLLAGRFDALIGGQDGYVKNARTGRTYGGRERQQLRGQLLWLPGPSTEIRLIGDYVHHRGTINGPVYRVVGATGAVIEALSGVPLIAYDHAVYRTQIDDDAPRFEESDILGATLAAENQTVIGELTLLASARRAEAERSYDVDNGPADIANDPRDGERFEDYTVELRLQGVEGRVDYLIGVHAARQTISSRDSYTAGSDFESYIHALSGGFIPMFTGLPAGDNFPAGTGVDDVFRQRATSFALFTHEIFALGDRTDITLGARYTWEEKSLAADIESDNPGCAAAVTNFGPSLAGVPAALQGVLCIPNLDPRYDGRHADERNEGNWSGVAALSHQFSDAVSAYAQYSRGYKAGGYQLDRSGMNPIAPSLDQVSYSAEIADSFEAGMHGASMDGRWRFGAAIFHTSFNDYQFSYFTGLNRRTQNVPELVTKGVEFEGKFSPVMALEFAFALAYQKVRFGDSGFPSGLAQLEGTIAPLAPRWVVAGSATYRDDVQGLGLTLLGNVDIRWQSRSDVGASATPTDQFSQAAYATVGARIGVMTRDEGWRLDFWGRNIFDKRAWSILNSTTLQPGSISGYVADPQTFGIAGSVAL